MLCFIKILQIYYEEIFMRRIISSIECRHDRKPDTTPSLGIATTG